MLPPRGSQAAGGRDSAAGTLSESAHEELVSEVAHAFRTPLGVITGYVELLQLRDDPALRAEALPRIEGAAQRLALAIDGLVSVLESDPELAERFLEPHRAQSHGRRRLEAARLASDFRDRAARDTARVVIVDDDDEVRQLLLRTLPASGFEILEARDGHEALALLERETPDLLLLDWHMPNATGEDVLAELARRGLSVPVIVLTADDDPKRREIAEAHGAAVFLAKPFSPIELLGAIERLLG